MKKSDTIEKVKSLLFDYPTRRFHVREISRLLKTSAPAVSKALSDLEKKEFVTIKKNFLHEITANRKEDFLTEKKIANLQKVYSSGLFKVLKESFPLSTIVLFGSYERGEDAEKSDIDIAIMAKEKKIHLAKYEDLLKRKINILFVNMKKISKELRNNILNGIVLSGSFENEL